MSVVIAPIVEGHGDIPAIRVLLQMVVPAADVRKPVRCPKTKMLRLGEQAAEINEAEVLRSAQIALAGTRADRKTVLLVVFDADEDCPRTLGPAITRLLRGRFPERSIYVAMAIREFENWIVGGIEELGVEDPERAGQPKQRLREINSGLYSETVDQPKLTARVNVDRLRQNSPSFRRLHDFLTQIASEDPV